jgi:pSer/pThr/pTyr-binding forkhead associated (FHA) protein
MTPSPEGPLQLVCLQGKERGQRFLLRPGTTLVIGRDPGEHGLLIGDLLASRRHAAIHTLEQHVEIEDLKSANGTRVNGKILDQRVTMLHGDILTVGHSSFVLEDARVQSSSDHLSDSTRTHRRQQSQRLKRQLQRQRTVLVDSEREEQRDEPSLGAGGQALLTDILANLPLALLMVDHAGRILLANEVLRGLTEDVDILPGQAADPLFAALSRQLVFPEDLHTAISSDDPRPMRMELADRRHWLVWNHRNQDRCLIFILADDPNG